MNKILFIGATGMLGKPVAETLIKAGYPVTLFGRDTTKMGSVFPDTALVEGDIFRKETLLNAMKGQEIVYLNLSVGQSSKQKDPQPEREGIDNIIAAAKEAGIKRLAYLSSLVHLYNGMNGFNWWAFDIKKAAVAKIKASGIASTIFYPSTFMETFPYQMMRGKNIALLGSSKMPMWFIAAADYGRQVAKSFETTDNNNRDYPVQGPAPYTFDEAAEIFIENYPKEKLKTMKAPIRIMKLLGSFNQKFNYGWHICEALNKYPEKFESEQTWNELGKPVITLARYAQTT